MRDSLMVANQEMVTNIISIIKWANNYLGIKIYQNVMSTEI